MAKIETMVKVAQELQKLCEFEPPIKTKGKSEEELTAILEEAAVALTPDDALSADAKKLFKELGITIGTPEAEVVEEEVVEEEVEEEEVEEEEVEEEEVEEEEPEEEEEEEAPKAKKEKVKKEKPAKAEKAPKAPKEKKAKKEKATKVKTALGTVEGTQAGGIDKVLIAHKGKFVSAEDISKEAGVNASRINTHISFLNKNGRATIEVKKDGKAVSYKLVKAGS